MGATARVLAVVTAVSVSPASREVSDSEYETMADREASTRAGARSHSVVWSDSIVYVCLAEQSGNKYETTITTSEYSEIKELQKTLAGLFHTQGCRSVVNISQDIRTPARCRETETTKIEAPLTKKEK